MKTANVQGALEKILITPKESVDLTNKSFHSVFLPKILSSDTFLADLLQHYDHLDTIQLLLICYYQIVPNHNVNSIGLENMEIKDLLNIFIDEDHTKNEIAQIFDYNISEGKS